MRDLTVWLIFFLLPVTLVSQTLTLEEAYDISRKNYPLIQQRDLIAKTASINIENLSKNYLPQLSINGQATYQSDVTRVEVPIPGIKIDAPQQDQYKITADITQLIYDGGINRQQKILQQLSSEVSDQQLEVELYKLKDRINQLFLGVMLIDEQIRQVEILRTDINLGIRRVEAQVKNGVAFTSNLNVLKAELIKNNQRLIELRSGRKGLLDVLALFTGKPLTEETILTISTDNVRPSEITRPELSLFEHQTNLLNQQNKLIRARNLPKTSFFLQGGYGRPGLNLLKNEFDFFYIGGIRLNWALGQFYTSKNDKQLVKLNQEIVNTQKQTFLLNTNAELARQTNEIEKLDRLIDADREIIALRNTITEAAKAQLENGVITSSDYLREVNAADQAGQSLILHEIQLLQAKINYQTITGK